jgi:hypothetical protein
MVVAEGREYILRERLADHLMESIVSRWVTNAEKVGEGVLVASKSGVREGEGALTS